MKYNSIIIVGPTASGKTSFSVELAKQINGEIVNCDSQQIYKQLNIGTAKPTNNEMQNIKHHLIDIVEANDSFSVSEYKKVALDCIKHIIDNKKIPIIVGGTGFYVQSLMYDYEYANTSNNDQIRDKYVKIQQQYGNEYLHNLLLKVDKQSAEKLHFNDTKRVIRALEIFESTGQKKSDYKNDKKTFLRPLVIYLDVDRNILYDRINKRVDQMMSDGLLNEIENLLKNGLNENCQSMSAIGYKEFFNYFNNNQSLEQTIDLIKQHSRNYAKRQVTWFTRQLECYNVKILEQDLTDSINQVINEYNS